MCFYDLVQEKKTFKMGTDATLFPRINNKPSILIFLFNLIIFILFIWLNIPMVGQRQYHSVSWINMNEHVRFFFQIHLYQTEIQKKIRISETGLKFRLYRCWWRMLVTYVGDEMLQHEQHPLFFNIRYQHSKNVNRAKFCHQHPKIFTEIKSLCSQNFRTRSLSFHIL